MKEKNQIEKTAAERQVALLSEALEGAKTANGHWLNASGKPYPSIYPKGVAVSPFNALVMALHSDKQGAETNLYLPYTEAKARGIPVREHERGVPFLFYNWNRYVNRNNPEDKITRADYLQLPEEQQKQYKGIHNREIRTLFNLDQTIMPHANEQDYGNVLSDHGHKQRTAQDEKDLRSGFNTFLTKIRANLVPVRTDGSGVAHYESDKDAVYVPRQKDFEHYNDYVQETLRQIVAATGHQQRLAREGMVMKNGMAPSEDAVKQEKLIAELASGVKMLELGLPARLSDDNIKLADYWQRELKENPCLIDVVETEVNNALTVMHKAERGEKIEYATMRNRQETRQMNEQLPKHYYVADEISQRPDAEKKTLVVVIDKTNKAADVVLPRGASLEVDNEIKGMSKVRIQKALEKDGITAVRFFNPDGALGYRPDDSYFADKDVAVARLKNWSLETLSMLNTAPAVARAGEVTFDNVQFLKDDKDRWAMYLKPEGASGYSVYPDKADLNHFFTTLKQSMDNIDKVRLELAQKYYALAETKPDLKVDLFGTADKDIDLNRIDRVVVFKTKKDGILCAATIDGQKLQARSVTPAQWQRMWIAEDKDAYKKHLASSIFADVLQKTQERNNVADTQETEHREYHEDADREEQKQEAEHREYHEQEDRSEQEESEAEEEKEHQGIRR